MSKTWIFAKFLEIVYLIQLLLLANDKSYAILAQKSLEIRMSLKYVVVHWVMQISGCRE
jgi:hypothetical protein